ncbi:MAG: hypothetical protein NVSMB18_19100 [Acetobacteraceae bacterium]
MCELMSPDVLEWARDLALIGQLFGTDGADDKHKASRQTGAGDGRSGVVLVMSRFRMSAATPA